jgi:hypothetical protein
VAVRLANLRPARVETRGIARMPPIPLFDVRDRLCNRESKWSSTDRLVALAIADHMDRTGRSWPSIRRLADWTCLAPRTVERAVERLCGAEGPFLRTPGGSAAGAHGRPTSEYQLRPTPVTESGVFSTTPVAKSGVTPGTVTGDPRHRVARPPSHGRTEGPIEGTTEGNNPTPTLPFKGKGAVEKSAETRAVDSVIRAVGSVLPGLASEAEVQRKIARRVRAVGVERALAEVRRWTADTDLPTWILPKRVLERRAL